MVAQGSSYGSASDFNVDGKGFAPQTGSPCLGSPSLKDVGYTGKQVHANFLVKKGILVPTTY